MSTVSLQDCSLSFIDEAEENSESFLYPSCELKDEPSLNEGESIEATNINNLKTNYEGEKKRVEVSWLEVSSYILLHILFRTFGHYVSKTPGIWTRGHRSYYVG